VWREAMKIPPLPAALPCKYCGSDEYSMGLTDDDEVYVQCENLHCLAQGPLADSPREAVEKWNANLDAKEQPEDDVGELELKKLFDKLFDLVEGNARVINEIYESVMTLRKAVAIVQTLLEEQLEDPEEQLKKVGLRHAEWDGKSPHPYGCDGGEGPDAGEPEIVLCHSEELEDDTDL
jgi:hypothetical protein